MGKWIGAQSDRPEIDVYLVVYVQLSRAARSHTGLSFFEKVVSLLPAHDLLVADDVNAFLRNRA